MREMVKPVMEWMLETVLAPEYKMEADGKAHRAHHEPDNNSEDHPAREGVPYVHQGGTCGDTLGVPPERDSGE